MEAIDDDFDAEIEAEIAEIRNHNITKGSRKNYEKSVAKFVAFLFLTNIQLVNPAFFYSPPPLCEPTEENVRRYFARNYEERVEATAPLVLSGITAKDFMRFCVSLRKKDGKKPTAGTLSGHRSALFHLFREFSTEMPAKLVSDLKVYFRGLKRKQTKDLGAGIGKLKLGKDPLDVEVYRLLCIEMIKSGQKDAIFAHCIATVSWNLACRVGNAVNLCWDHGEWRNDALSWFFAHTKTDQEGDVPRYPRHVYANTIQPEICAILSLAIYLMCFEPDWQGEPRLFPGGSQKQRYSKALKKVLNTPAVIEALKTFGLTPADIATHSFRKGCLSFLTSGTTDAPSSEACNIRAGHSTGSVHDTYHTYRATGDQHVGRTATGIPSSTTSFALLPPFFPDPSDPSVLLAVSLCFPNLPLKWVPIATMCVASVVWHFTKGNRFLEKTLSANHPLRSTPLFTQPHLMQQLSAKVECRLAKPTDRMSATGVPSNVYTLVKLESMMEQVLQVVPAVERSIAEVSVQPSQQARHFCRGVNPQR